MNAFACLSLLKQSQCHLWPLLAQSLTALLVTPMRLKQAGSDPVIGHPDSGSPRRCSVTAVAVMAIIHCLNCVTSPTRRSRPLCLQSPGRECLNFSPRHWVTISLLPTIRRATVEELEPACMQGKRNSNSKLSYDQRPFGQSVLVSVHHLEPANKLSFFSCWYYIQRVAAFLV
jgi:hypothetical protein